MKQSSFETILQIESMLSDISKRINLRLEQDNEKLSDRR